MTYDSPFWAIEGEVIPEVANFEEEGLITPEGWNFEILLVHAGNWTQVTYGWNARVLTTTLSRHWY